MRCLPAYFISTNNSCFNTEYESSLRAKIGPRLHWSVQIYDRTNFLTGAVRLHGTGQSLLQIAIFFNLPSKNLHVSQVPCSRIHASFCPLKKFSGPV